MDTLGLNEAYFANLADSIKVTKGADKWRQNKKDMCYIVNENTRRSCYSRRCKSLVLAVGHEFRNFYFVFVVLLTNLIYIQNMLMTIN
jgi:hypothetical protein